MPNLTIDKHFIEMYQGEDLTFDVAPGTLPGGFAPGTDVVTFRAKRRFAGAAVITVTPVPMPTSAVARVTIPAAATAPFGSWPVELHWVVTVVRAGASYDLDAGEMRVYPTAREA